MAVEAKHLNLFPLQLIQDRDMLNNQGITYNTQQMRVMEIPYGTTLPGNQSYYQTVVCDSVQAKTDSGLTYNVPAPPRKRSRDNINTSMNQIYSDFSTTQKNNNNNVSQSQFPSFGDDIFPQIQQHQLEIDTLISQHTKKIRYELEEKQKQHARLLATAIGEGVAKKLNEKDEQIQRMGKLNLVLQERVKSLFVENQLLRDLAQSNEATANSLRSNLEQVLAHVSAEERIEEDDVVSCCGSSNTPEEKQGEGENSSNCSDRNCRGCGERESSVLLLPCRHLCLCNVCGSGSQQLRTCPVCNSVMNATLHVNMLS